MSVKDDNKKEESTTSLTQQLVNCFNLNSNLIRDCESLSNELRRLHSVLSEHLQQEESQRETLLSRYQKVLETVLQIKESLNGLIASYENSHPNLAETFRAIDIIVKNCLSEQCIEEMEVPIGKPMKPGFQTTEGAHAVVHDSVPGTIVSVIRKGYIQQYDGKLIVVRPAVVTISAGPEKQNNLKGRKNV